MIRLHQLSKLLADGKKQEAKEAEAKGNGVNVEKDSSRRRKVAEEKAKTK